MLEVLKFMTIQELLLIMNVNVMLRNKVIAACRERVGVELNCRLGGQGSGDQRMTLTNILMDALRVSTHRILLSELD